MKVQYIVYAMYIPWMYMNKYFISTFRSSYSGNHNGSTNEFKEKKVL